MGQLNANVIISKTEAIGKLIYYFDHTRKFTKEIPTILDIPKATVIYVTKFYYKDTSSVRKGSEYLRKSV